MMSPDNTNDISNYLINNNIKSYVILNTYKDESIMNIKNIMYM